MAIVQIPAFYDASNFAPVDLIPFWRVSDGSMFNITYDELYVQIESSLGLSGFVSKSGDTMTGPLVISSGGLEVTNDISIGANLNVVGNATISGDLNIDGSLFVRSIETIDVSGAFINLNTGEAGTPPVDMQSGMIINRGTLEPYVFIFDESTEDFRIGISTQDSSSIFDDASTQAVATREDSPLDGGVALWNATLNRFDTSTYQPGGGGTDVSTFWQEDPSDNTTVILKDPSQNVQLSMIEVGEDSGEIQLVNMPVTSATTLDDKESYSFDIDGSVAMKIYGPATGSGGVKEIALVVEATYQYMGDPNTNGSWRFYVDGSSNLTFEKRVAGTWSFGGQFT